VSDSKVLVLPQQSHKKYGVCVGGRYDGWLMYQHPDGLWVTLQKLEAVDPLARPRADGSE